MCSHKLLAKNYQICIFKSTLIFNSLKCFPRNGIIKVKSGCPGITNFSSFKIYMVKSRVVYA